jgi:hypothetical protein
MSHSAISAAALLRPGDVLAIYVDAWPSEPAAHAQYVGLDLSAPATRHYSRRVIMLPTLPSPPRWQPAAIHVHGDTGTFMRPA